MSKRVSSSYHVVIHSLVNGSKVGTGVRDFSAALERREMKSSGQKSTEVKKFSKIAVGVHNIEYLSR